jgi:pyridoxamine 5'-phosphate oxidase
MMANDDAGLNGVSGHPLDLLARWAAEAEAAGAGSPRCFTFTTATADGSPHARTVLATRIDGDEVRFNTSRPSVKTADLAANPHAAGVFFWPAQVRQVTLHGRAASIDASPEDARSAYAAQSPNLRALAWTYEELGPGSAGAPVDPEVVRSVFERQLAADPPQPPPSWTTIALIPDRVDVWWMPDGAGIATRARFTRDGDGWSRHYVLP